MHGELILQPMGEVSLSQLNALMSDLSLDGFKVHLNDSIVLSSHAYNASRTQYRADALLGCMHDIPGDRVLGVTNQDMYVYVLDYIKGFADLPGRQALISLARLQVEPDNLRSRCHKLALHELGHTYGLQHCPRSDCVMHAAESMADIDVSAAELCECCVARLIECEKLYAFLN